MSRNTIFSILVHLPGTDLNFERFSVTIDHRGVQRLVVIGFFGCDVIVKFAGNWLEMHVNDAKHFIARLNIIDDYPHSPQVTD